MTKAPFHKRGSVNKALKAGRLKATVKRADKAHSQLAKPWKMNDANESISCFMEI